MPGNYKMPKAYLFCLLILTVGACKQPADTRDKEKLTSDQLMEINRELVMKDKERIQSFIERRNWQMQETASGLWFEIREPGKEPKPVSGNAVAIDYQCYLLNGTSLYNSAEEGPLRFKIGYTDVPPGLNEAVMHLGQGGKGRFILPAHLGYGLLGDEERIPSRAILVYEIENLTIVK